VQIIYCRDENGLRYYKHTSDSIPIFSGRRMAAKIGGDQLDKVVSHLKIMRPNAEIGLIDAATRMPRKTREAKNDAA
jgi:hypothetical protein